MGWTPSLSAPDAEARGGGRDIAVSRARDLVKNEPLAVAAINRKVDMAVGMRGVRFSALPDYEALGIDAEQGFALADQIERVWREWSEDALWRCDWERDESWGGLCNLMARHYFRDNEAFVVLRWDDVPKFGFKYRTSLHVVDPDRVSNPQMQMDTDRLRAGIETDGRQVVAYHIRNAHPSEWYTGGASPFSWTRVPRESDFGRPVVLHLRRKERAGEVRGWGALMATLRKFKDLSRYTDAEIQSAVVRAVMAMVIHTDRSTASAEDALSIDDMQKFAQASDAFHGDKGPRLADGTRIAKLFPTEKLEMLTASKDGGDFEAFSRTFSRHIAAALDISYEQMTMDWSQVNYSSARAALLEVWRSVESFIDLFVAKVAQPVLLALVDDALGTGEITAPDGAPDIYENPRAWLNGLWLGPGRGWVDPVKEPTGAGIEMALGGASQQEISARQGKDYRSTYAQRAREAREREKLGLPEPKPIAEIIALTPPDDPPEPPAGANGKP
jgi:lambda family phage portal protein